MADFGRRYFVTMQTRPQTFWLGFLALGALFLIVGALAHKQFMDGLGTGLLFTAAVFLADRALRWRQE